MECATRKKRTTNVKRRATKNQRNHLGRRFVDGLVDLAALGAGDDAAAGGDRGGGKAEGEGVHGVGLEVREGG